MGTLTHILTQECALLTTEQNIYGDQEEQASTEISCRLREITQIDLATNREDLTGVDAILWTEPDSGVVEGSIVKHEDKYWRVTRLTKARRFANDVLFLKCFLEKYQNVEAESEES